MRRIYQDRLDELGTGPGNCMQAAAASFLNLPLEAVPNFVETDDPDEAMREFFRSWDFELIDKPTGVVPPGYYFETGLSVHGHEHIVLARAGAVVHDPHRNGGGLVRRDGVKWPVPLTELARRFAFDAAPRRPAVEAPDLTLASIAPNAGVAAWYRDKLQDLARRMGADILRRLRRHYRPAAGRLALDDDPIVTLRTVMRIWGRLWQKRFDDMAKDVAEMFAKRSRAHLDIAFRKRLKEAGFTVRFRPTERMVSAYRAVVAENVNLIRSIPREFLKDVESAVWTAAMNGGSMSELSKDIREKYGVTYRRAAFIARDQIAKSKAVLENARRAELGITEAVWQHSAAGKVPRPTHVRMSGKRFKIAEGMYDSAVAKNVQPGELPNCRCTSRSILANRQAKI
jgi:SPP1 gp7 family putative phage head morphogenesis protein